MNKKYRGKLDMNNRVVKSMYRVWSEMKRRCNNPKCPAYPNYGGRGISVCDAWVKSFEQFYKDMGIRKDSSLTLERINVDGNYEPSNCKWATRDEQANNRRNNVFIEYRGNMYTIKEFADKTGKPYNLVRNKIQSKGTIITDLRDFFSRKQHQHSPHFTYKGEPIRVMKLRRISDDTIRGHRHNHIYEITIVTPDIYRVRVERRGVGLYEHPFLFHSEEHASEFCQSFDTEKYFSGNIL